MDSVVTKTRLETTNHNHPVETRHTVPVQMSDHLVAWSIHLKRPSKRPPKALQAYEMKDGYESKAQRRDPPYKSYGNEHSPIATITHEMSAKTNLDLNVETSVEPRIISNEIKPYRHPDQPISPNRTRHMDRTMLRLPMRAISNSTLPRRPPTRTSFSMTRHSPVMAIRLIHATQVA